MGVWPTESEGLNQPAGWGTSNEDWDFTPEMANYIKKLKLYENATKIDNMTEYSSDSVEKFSIDNMKKIILNSDLLPK